MSEGVEVYCAFSGWLPGIGSRMMLIVRSDQSIGFRHRAFCEFRLFCRRVANMFKLDSDAQPSSVGKDNKMRCLLCTAVVRLCIYKQSSEQKEGSVVN